MSRPSPAQSAALRASLRRAADLKLRERSLAPDNPKFEAALARVVYEETLRELTGGVRAGGMAEICAVAKALAIARRVVARAGAKQ